jgi:16S rRNA (guanine1516-N2)-methyltransferase
LGRAIGVKAERKPLIWDATGGLGRDAFVLADLGCHVTLIERIPVLAWLVNEAVNAASVSAYQQVREAAARMTVITGDSLQTGVPPDAVLYVDPMFPERKKAAAVKKDAVMLQRLAGTIDDVDQLWSWAWAQPVERIVVKRPLRAPLLGSQRPSHTLSGKSVRFDVFVRPRYVDPLVGTEV